MKIKYIVSVLLIILITSTTIKVFATDSVYVWSNQSSTVSTSANLDNSNTEKEGNFLNLTSGSAILIEQNTGKILYEHNSHEKLKPASVTKIMSILLIMESIDNGKITLQDKVPCTQKAASMGGSQIWLDVREELTVDEMLKAICVVSANDCTVAMAEYLEGSEEMFVEKMNAKAKELGMNDTTFKNCHGIDEDGHETSAYDIALMSKELMTKHPSITNYTTIWMDSLRDGQSELVNTNKLVRNYTGATGLKTGSTSIALYNLSATATRNDLSLIAVIMRGETSAIRFSEAQKLLDYGFSTYAYKQFGNKDDIVKSIKVEKGIESTLNVVYEKDAGSLIKKGREKDITQTIDMEETISAPIYKGEKIGEAIFTIEGEEVGRVNLVAQNDIKKTGILNMVSYIYALWFNVLR